MVSGVRDDDSPIVKNRRVRYKMKRRLPPADLRQCVDLTQFPLGNGLALGRRRHDGHTEQRWNGGHHRTRSQ